MSIGEGVRHARYTGRQVDRFERLAGAFLPIAAFFAATAMFTADGGLDADALGRGLLWTACNPLWVIAVALPLLHPKWTESMTVWWAIAVPVALTAGWGVGLLVPVGFGAAVTALIVLGIMAAVLSSPARD